MLFRSVLLLTGAVAVSHALEFGAASHQQNGMSGLMRRSTQCKDVAEPNCQNSCGPEYKSCVHAHMCFNPSKGETCCQNGTFCPPGTYCAEGGCCPNNMTLEECRAIKTLTLARPTRSTEETTTSTTTTTSTSTTVVTTWVEPEPTEKPTEEPTEEPTEMPTREPTEEPTTRSPPLMTNPTSASGTGSYPSTTPGTNATITMPEPPPHQTDSGAGRIEGAATALGLGLVAYVMCQPSKQSKPPSLPRQRARERAQPKALEDAFEPQTAEELVHQATKPQAIELP
ncbi:predicted protein [Uncinocarpus reesii 1704]|uniref:Uncharacterized protein n=1 Tax=Uncinocarpus reesii (strain UAMH 1704) TaxID=336963 RepID=C4JWZ6_UNCRE|nr:uncharacterized protein UREG_06169 [Uncinocarpus reesii 1704]EEP81304.1 predicted protein [Uncinocarpus reesii 1704]